MTQMWGMGQQRAGNPGGIFGNWQFAQPGGPPDAAGSLSDAASYSASPQFQNPAFQAALSNNARFNPVDSQADSFGLQVFDSGGFSQAPGVESSIPGATEDNTMTFLPQGIGLDSASYAYPANVFAASGLLSQPGSGLTQNTGLDTSSNNAFDAYHPTLSSSEGFAAGDTTSGSGGETGTTTSGGGTSSGAGSGGDGEQQEFTMKELIEMELYGTTAKKPDWNAFFSKIVAPEEKPVKVSSPEGFNTVGYDDY